MFGDEKDKDDASIDFIKMWGRFIKPALPLIDKETEKIFEEGFKYYQQTKDKDKEGVEEKPVKLKDIIEANLSVNDVYFIDGDNQEMEKKKRSQEYSVIRGYWYDFWRIMKVSELQRTYQKMCLEYKLPYTFTNFLGFFDYDNVVLIVIEPKILKELKKQWRNQ